MGSSYERYERKTIDDRNLNAHIKRRHFENKPQFTYEPPYTPRPNRQADRKEDVNTNSTVARQADRQTIKLTTENRQKNKKTDACPPNRQTVRQK